LAFGIIVAGKSRGLEPRISSTEWITSLKEPSFESEGTLEAAKNLPSGENANGWVHLMLEVVNS
jgi:hypothetical protein